MSKHKPCPMPLEIWQMFFAGYGTSIIAETVGCEEWQIYNSMGKTRGSRYYQRAKASG